MARHLALRPFRALRYSPERVPDLGSVTSPPYDMLDDETAAALRRSEPHNVVRLTLDPDGANTAARRLSGWRADGVLVTDSSPALYGYEQRFADQVVQRGLLGALEIREESEGIILPHEDVMPGPVQGRLALLRATEANLEPLLLTYDGRGGVTREVLSEPKDELLRAVVPGTEQNGTIEYRVWKIDDPGVLASVASDLADRQALIADGHHRYAAARALQAERGAGGPWDSVLTLLVDHERYPPEVGAIHRVVDGLALDTVVEPASEPFVVEPVESPLASATPEADTDTVWATDGARWARLRPRTRDQLPVQLVDEQLLRSLINIPEEGVRYVHDRDGAVRTAQVVGGTAFLLPPTNPRDVLTLALRGQRMPRKSTSFGPKPRTGLVLRTFEPRGETQDTRPHHVAR